MGKAGRWLRSFLMGWREKKGGTEPSPLPTETRTVLVSGPAPKERRRWSFQRSAEAGKGMNSPDLTAPRLVRRLSASEIDRKSHAMAVAVATAAAADAAVAASQAAAAARAAATAVRMTSMITGGGGTSVEEAAAIKIQAIFRSYLARRALCALKGLVKLQAMVRGHLVRKQATATLRSMQALVMAQVRARAQRIRMVEAAHAGSQQQSSRRRAHDHLHQQSYEMDRSSEENVKIVEMDHGESRGSSKSRNSYSTAKTERKDDRFAAYYCGIQEQYQQFSPAPSTSADISPGVNSEDMEEISFATTQSNRQYFSSDVSVPDATQASFGYPFFPNYMANTESSQAKVRSQSAPKQRPDSYERQSSRRRSSVEGRNIPKGVKIQRSSSNGSTTIGHQHPSSFKLNKSTMSLKDSECGSTSSVLTDTKYCRSVVAYEVRMY